MEISLDVSKLIEKFTKKNKKQILEIIKLDKDNKKIIVDLGIGGGMSFRYFTNADIELESEGNFLRILVK